MQALFDKMKEYLNMDTEITFEEFDSYYKDVVAFLNDNWANLNEDETLHMLFILDNIKSNSEDRGKRRTKETKKYKKMEERSSIWASALIRRLRELGLSDEEISKRYEEIYEAV
ncbi:hypothetical protein LOK74_01455 [Brevibacillus humidisoli]|uniref:hypothetical protein n=1 Tax=Brevibacillus humidisoli TaxID=2895522 RepID=UPI001E58D027|nr:hypothetical protein [Brevibacillus humidisoli]UFJ41248.1 hypothetical protein LOK74_01455 [Brevibacillus humidisoli]